MTKKIALYAVGVLVLAGSMAVVSLAGEMGLNSHGEEFYSDSSQPEQSTDVSYVGEMREPVETGSLPDRREGSSDVSSSFPTEEIGGQFYRQGIDTGGQ